MNIFIDWDEMDYLVTCAAIDASGEVWAYDDEDLELLPDGMWVSSDGNIMVYLFTIKDYQGQPMIIERDSQLPQWDDNVSSSDSKPEASFKQRLINLLNEYEFDKGVALTNISIDRLSTMSGEHPIAGIAVDGVLL